MRGWQRKPFQSGTVEASRTRIGNALNGILSSGIVGALLEGEVRLPAWQAISCNEEAFFFCARLLIVAITQKQSAEIYSILIWVGKLAPLKFYTAYNFVLILYSHDKV